jgi:hypothetical protein
LGVVAVSGFGFGAACFFVGAGGEEAEIVNANEQAAQRARWPIILMGTARLAPQPGQATVVVSDWVEAIWC